MVNTKNVIVAFVLIVASFVILYVDFTNKLIFLISFAATLLGAKMANIELIPGGKSTHKFSIILFLIIFAITIITSYYVLFLEIAVGGYMGFFTAKMLRKKKK